MHLTNQYPLHVYWRAFSTSDTSYVIGLRDGWVAPGTRTDLYSHPSGQFQMEFKSGAAWHPFIKRAGDVFNNDDELVITPDGQVQKLEEALSVEPDPGTRREIAGTVTDFLDRQAFDGDSPAEVISTFSTVVTSSGGLASKTTSRSSTETGRSAGGEVTGKGAFKGIEVGVKFSGSVSDKIAHSTTRDLSADHDITSVTSTGSTVKLPLVLRGRTITVVHWVWERVFVTGRTRVGGQVYEWEVTTGLQASHRLEQYTSVADMPPAVFDAYRAKFPNSALSLLRPGATLLVDGNSWLGHVKIARVDAAGNVEGTIYDQPLSGRWDPASGMFSFTRTIHPTYLQRWQVRVVSDTDMKGSFTEEVNGVAQTTSYPCRLSTHLKVMGNGHPGELRLDDLQPDGSLRGRIYADVLQGRWDAATRRLRFQRQNGSTSYAQDWDGQRTGELMFAGSFQERINGQLAPGVYGWDART